MKINDTWLIFGCSPFISEIKDKIPALLKKYNSIGVNFFPVFFPECEYWLFNDAGVFTNLVKPYYKNQKLIINKHLESELRTYWFRKNQCIIQDEFLIKPHYIFESVIDEPVLQKNGKLFGAHTSILHAINFAILENAKNAVLIGIDLIPSWTHFYDNTPIKKPLKQIEVIKDHLNQLSKHIKIYKANPNAALNFDFIDLNEL